MTIKFPEGFDFTPTTKKWKRTSDKGTGCYEPVSKNAVLDEAIEVVKNEFTGEAYYLDLFISTIENLKD